MDSLVNVHYQRLVSKPEAVELLRHLPNKDVVARIVLEKEISERHNMMKQFVSKHESMREALKGEYEESFGDDSREVIIEKYDHCDEKYVRVFLNGEKTKPSGLYDHSRTEMAYKVRVSDRALMYILVYLDCDGGYDYELDEMNTTWYDIKFNDPYRSRIKDVWT
jgi:hypothetical protein